MPRPALSRLAAACAAAVPATVVVQAPLPVNADEPLLVESCNAETLPIEDVQQGATVEVQCEWVEPDELAGRLSGTLLATHYDATSGNGDYLNVWGNCGESLALGAGDPWNNRISSTRHRACGSIKHFDNALLSGTNETTNASPNVLVVLTTMNDQTSSIGYGT